MVAKSRNQKEKPVAEDPQAAVPAVSNIMTSELAYLSREMHDSFGQEYVRRLKMIGFSDETVTNLYNQEHNIAISGDMNGQRKQPWFTRYFIMHNSTPETMPKSEDMTLSELILITDDANSGFWRDHESLPKEAWQALCIAACCAQYTEARYAHGFENRTEKELGWSKAQGGAFTKNECLLLERLKWNYHDKPAWTNETTDLKQYEK